MTVLDLLQAMLVAQPGQVAALPLAESYALARDQVRGFGLAGDLGARRIATSLDLAPGPGGAIPLQAMFEGELSWIGEKVALDPPRRDGTYFVTARAGLLLKVNPRAGLRRALAGNVDYPLELPLPLWVVYEGGAAEATLLDQGGIEHFEVLNSFAFDSYVLPPGREALLDDLAADMLLDTSLKARLEGYTDAEGDSDYNLDLGRRRAAAVRDYLVGQNIDPQRITVNTFGEGRPREPAPTDRDAAAINRRVEIHLLSSVGVQVKAGDAIGGAANGVTITVLDPLSYYLDPLDLVLRLRPELASHPLAAAGDPLAPAITSGNVRCVSPNPVGDSPAVGGGTFSFHGTLAEAVAAAGELDTVWVCTGYAPGRLDLGAGGLQINKAISIAGKPDASGAPPRLLRSADGPPLLNLVAPASGLEYGLRLLGLTGFNEQNNDGAALTSTGLKNLHIGHCQFTAFKSADDGGAISLYSCSKVLVESSTFVLNSARYGGAIFAQDCRQLVISGARCPTLGDLLASEDVLPASFLPSDIPGPVPGVPAALTGLGFDSRFVNQSAREGGGAVALRNCSFRVSHSYFAENGNGARYGGAIGIQLDDTGLAEIESAIARSVLAANVASCGGGICAVGKYDGNQALVGQPHTVLGGGRVRISESAIHGNSASIIGAGVHLLPGHYYLERNRIAQNSAFRNGGGVACIGRCTAEFDGNLVLANKITRQDPGEPPGGGGGIYATFFTGQDFTTITLRGNRVLANLSTETGGGLRATCGTRVNLESGNLFKDNLAYLHGGAIATNDARLTIGPGNRFETNRTQAGLAGYHQGGNGGAIYCAGDFPSRGAFNDFVFAACAADGSTLDIGRAGADKVSFAGNVAAQQGGAIYVFQQVDMTAPEVIGTLRLAMIQNADFSGDNSRVELGSATEHYIGSAIVLEGLTRWQHLLNHNFGDSYGLHDLTLTLTQGVGIYLIDSAEIERSNVTVQAVSGANTIKDELIVNR